MKLSPNSSGRDVSGRTDLPTSQESVNAAHLVEIATRSVGRSEVSVELALAWTVTTRPYVSGTRGLARWAGLTSRSVRETVAQDRQVSQHGFIWTRTRGASSPTAEEREQMEIRYRSNTRTQGRSTSPNLNTGNLGRFYPLDPFGFGGIDDGDGRGGRVFCTMVGCAFEGPVGHFAFDDTGVGSAASWWQESFEEFSVGCFDRTGESVGGKTPPGR